jgi:WW domain-containing oxidoreductase
MKVTAIESGIEGRVVIVASNSYKHPYREGIRFDKINDESGYNKIFAYGQSKLANILHSNLLSSNLKVPLFFLFSFKLVFGTTGGSH